MLFYFDFEQNRCCSIENWAHMGAILVGLLNRRWSSDDRTSRLSTSHRPHTTIRYGYLYFFLNKPFGYKHKMMVTPVFNMSFQKCYLVSFITHREHCKESIVHKAGHDTNSKSKASKTSLLSFVSQTRPFACAE